MPEPKPSKKQKTHNSFYRNLKDFKFKEKIVNLEGKLIGLDDKYFDANMDTVLLMRELKSSEKYTSPQLANLLKDSQGKAMGERQISKFLNLERKIHKDFMRSVHTLTKTKRNIKDIKYEGRNIFEHLGNFLESDKTFNPHGTKKIDAAQILSPEKTREREIIQSLLKAIQRVKQFDNVKALTIFLLEQTKDFKGTCTTKAFYLRITRFMHDLYPLTNLHDDQIKAIKELISNDQELNSDKEISLLLNPLITTDPMVSEHGSDQSISTVGLKQEESMMPPQPSNTSEGFEGQNPEPEGRFEDFFDTLDPNALPDMETGGKVTVSMQPGIRSYDQRYVGFWTAPSNPTSPLNTTSDSNENDKPLIFSTAKKERLEKFLDIKLDTKSTDFYIAPTAHNLSKKLKTYTDKDELRFSLFAGKCIRKDDEICDIIGEEITEEEAQNFNADYINANYIFDLKPGKSLYTKNKCSEARFIQGAPSGMANVEIKEENDRFYYVALKDISPGKEIVAYFGSNYPFAKKPTTLVEVATKLNENSVGYKIGLTIDEEKCLVSFISIKPTEEDTQTAESKGPQM